MAHTKPRTRTRKFRSGNAQGGELRNVISASLGPEGEGEDDDGAATDGDGAADPKNALLAAIRKKAKKKKKTRKEKSAADDAAGAKAVGLDELKAWAFEFESFRARASSELARVEEEHAEPMKESVRQLCEYFGESAGARGAAAGSLTPAFAASGGDGADGGGDGAPNGSDPAQRVFETLHQVLVAFNDSVEKLRRQRDAAERLARHAEREKERRATLQLRGGSSVRGARRAAQQQQPAMAAAADGGGGDDGVAASAQSAVGMIAHDDPSIIVVESAIGEDVDGPSPYDAQELPEEPPAVVLPARLRLLEGL